MKNLDISMHMLTPRWAEKKPRGGGCILTIAPGQSMHAQTLFHVLSHTHTRAVTQIAQIVAACSAVNITIHSALGLAIHAVWNAAGFLIFFYKCKVPEDYVTVDLQSCSMELFKEGKRGRL